MRSAKFTAPEKEVEKTKEGQLDADAFNKKRMAKFEDAPTATLNGLSFNEEKFQ